MDQSGTQRVKGLRTELLPPQARRYFDLQHPGLGTGTVNALYPDQRQNAEDPVARTQPPIRIQVRDLARG